MEAKVMFNGETLVRKIRRVRKLENGGYSAYASLGGKDTRLFKAPHKRIWTPAS